MSHVRVPCQCVIAPYMFERLAQHGDPRVRAQALQTLQLSARIRGQRDILRGISLRRNQFGPTPNELNRSVYTASNTMQLPGTLVRSEGSGDSADQAVNEAYDGLGSTYNLYKEAFGRNSLDDNGLPLIATVHYSQQYDNAEFNGTQMLFGDGDGTYFNRFTIAIDVIGHELTHGVTQYTSNLEYHDQPGALNESFSDIFGSMVKQYSLGQMAEDADWLIGEGLLTSIVQSGDPSHGPALRSMLKPGTAFDDPVFGKDPQPDNMSGFVHTQSDNGGVHTNSGIPNRAFAIAAQSIGGYSWEGAGQIWYKTLLRLHSRASFQDAANLTFQIAGEEPFGSEYQKTVRDAWAQVGIRVGHNSPRKPAPKQCETNGSVNRLDKIEDQIKRLTDLVSKKLAK